ncbi:MAG TPA: alpha/beta hydrolase [Longilinea sp.]|nr:alpha/beta hydrolase [Longilinea sp.]
MTKPSTEFQDLSDMRVAYWQCGGGPDLLLLHGNSESKAIFAEYPDQFPNFHIWALDSRCQGESRSLDDSLSIEQVSNDVIRFCEAKGIKQAAVVGYSDGGNVALFLAKKAPQLFTKVVAISPNTLVSGSTDGMLRVLRIVVGLLNFLAGLGFNVKKTLLVINLMTRDIGLSFEDLKEIKTSVKVIYAEKDLIKEKHIKDIAAAIPGSSLDKVPGCTHLSIIRTPSAIRIMQDYLQKSI